MDKKMKLQATPATLTQKNPEAEAQSTEEQQVAQEEFERQCELRNQLIRRRMYMFGALAEEAGEVAQVVGKIIRFGERDYHEKSGNIPNIELLHDELQDLFAVALELGWKPDMVKVKEKQVKLEKYWRYALAGGNHGADTRRKSEGEGQATSQ